MEEIELEKETYEKVVSLIQSGKSEEALEAILPEANDDPALAKTVLGAIEQALKRRSKLSPSEGRGTNETTSQGDSSSSDSNRPPTTSIALPSEAAPHREKKSALLGDHKGICEIELEKATYHRVVDLIKAKKREQALEVILEEANRSKTLATQVLEAIESTLSEKPRPELASSPAADPVSPVMENEKSKAEKKQVQISEPAREKPLLTRSELDPAEKPKRALRRTSLIVCFFGGILGYWFYRAGMRPRKAILTNLAICLIVGLAIGYFSFTSHFDGGLPGSDPADQEMLNYVAVAMCPLLADNLDFHSGQRSFCDRKRNRFAYYLYEESRKIDGLDTIQGPFSEETLQAGLYILGKEIRSQLNRSQRKKFLKLYEDGQWPPVDIVDDDGRLRLEYPKYGNAPGVLPLSVASRE